MLSRYPPKSVIFEKGTFVEEEENVGEKCLALEWQRNALKNGETTSFCLSRTRSFLCYLAKSFRLPTVEAPNSENGVQHAALELSELKCF